MLHRQPTPDEMRAAFEASRLPPKENFERMVRNGLINRKGQLTKLVGGEAEPEPGAKRPSDSDADSNGKH